MPGDQARFVRFPAGVHCGAGCSEIEGYRCEYVDASGNQCVWWCRNHTVFIEGQAWCRRHASLVRWLQPRLGGSGQAIYDAPIDDRSPSLVESIVDMLDVAVSQALARAFAMHPNVGIVADDHVRPASIRATDVEPTGSELSGPEGRQGAWERGWSVHSQVGNLARIVLRATATEPPVIHLYTNGRHVLRRVPDWIANRDRGGDTEADRHTFARAIVECIELNLGLLQEPRNP